MSWTYTVPARSDDKPVPVEDFDLACDEALELARPLIEQGNAPGIDQAVVAASVAKSVVRSGVVGKGLVRATMTGHGNPGHVPAKGWANDYVSINIYSQEPTS